MKKPKRYHGFVHTLPTKTKKERKRVKGYLRQLKKYGFDWTESWDFGPTTITSFIYPRFKAFRHTWKRSVLKNKDREEWKAEHNKGVKELNRDIELAYRAFKIIYKSEVKKSRKDKWSILQDKNNKKVQKGLQAFARVYLCLWN
jgi:hypothetical protein